MLVSAIISRGLLLADAPNTSFYTAAEQLADVQLSWKQVYAFLCDNDDDYFVTVNYIPPTVNVVGTVTNGSPNVTLVTPSTTGIYVGASVADSAGFVPALTTVLSITSAAQFVMSLSGTNTQALDNVTVKNFREDTNRQFMYEYTLPTDFYRLRMLQYKQSLGGINFLPVEKATIANFGNGQAIPAYRFKGTSLMVYDPGQYSMYCMWYYPAPATLLTTTDLAHPNNMIPELMSYQLAVEIRRKQKLETDLWQEKVNELYGTMKQQMSRDDNRAESVKDSFQSQSGYDW